MRGNFEIGRILHLKSEIRKFLIGLRLTESNLRFRNFGFEMGFCPISQFPPAGYSSMLLPCARRGVFFPNQNFRISKLSHYRVPGPFIVGRPNSLTSGQKLGTRTWDSSS